MRLVFHDCVRYTDGTGGCDGCLNWGGVGDPHPNPNDVMNAECFKKTLSCSPCARLMTSLPSSH